MLNDQELEAALKKSPSMTRVTKEYMSARIQRVVYEHKPANVQTLTICIIELDNGFTVVGTSACVDPANFNEEIGKTIAYERAYTQLWPLFGFLLAETVRLDNKKDA